MLLDFQKKKKLEHLRRPAQTTAVMRRQQMPKSKQRKTAEVTLKQTTRAVV